MQRNSVTYILGFCAVICLVCSVIVSGSAVGLKDKQEFNKVLDRQKKVLVVAGLMEDGEALLPQEIRARFAKRIKAVIVDLKTGKIDEEATKNVAAYDQKKATKDPAKSQAAPKNLAGVPRIPNSALVYQVSKDEMDDTGKGFSLDQYIFPVEGKGLWSTLYGYVAMAPDCNQIKGLEFYQHAETPGLGGEVDNPKWKAKWPGKLAFGDLGSDPAQWKKVQIAVLKAGGDGKQHGVDSLSGATITSNGVTYLLHFWLGDHGFGPYIQNVAVRPS
jgi:Na+-transporting NADH:ubiquinone oxidoreductase subunit C